MSYGMKVTAIGAAKIASATTLGGAVVLSKVLWGDANGTPYTPTGAETALVNKRHETDVESVVIDTEQPNVIRVEGLITNAPSSFMCHEVGIEDEDGDLIMIGNHPQQYIPSPSDESQLNYRPTFMVAVSNTGVVTVNITPETDFLTREEADILYDPYGSGVRRVDAGWAIKVLGSLPYPAVHADADVLDARYWKRTDTIPLPTHRHDNATQLADGFMSKEDKTKLDGISILGGTSIMNKVAQVTVSAPTSFIDLLNLPNVEHLYVLAMGVEFSADFPDPPTPTNLYEYSYSFPAIRLQTGNGASLYTGGADYGASSSLLVMDDSSGVTTQANNLQLFLPKKTIDQTAPSVIRRTKAFGISVAYLGSASFKTSVVAGQKPEDALDLIPAIMESPGGLIGINPARSAATAENRIRLICPGRQWTAGRFMAFAVAA